MSFRRYSFLSRRRSSRIEAAKEEARQRAAEEARERAEAKARAQAQAREQAEARAREQAEARAKAEAEARAKAEAEAKAVADKAAQEADDAEPLQPLQTRLGAEEPAPIDEETAAKADADLQAQAAVPTVDEAPTRVGRSPVDPTAEARESILDDAAAARPQLTDKLPESVDADVVAPTASTITPDTPGGDPATAGTKGSLDPRPGTVDAATDAAVDRTGLDPANKLPAEVASLLPAHGVAEMTPQEAGMVTSYLEGYGYSEKQIDEILHDDAKLHEAFDDTTAKYLMGTEESVLDAETDVLHGEATFTAEEVAVAAKTLRDAGYSEEEIAELTAPPKGGWVLNDFENPALSKALNSIAEKQILEDFDAGVSDGDGSGAEGGSIQLDSREGDPFGHDPEDDGTSEGSSQLDSTEGDPILAQRKAEAERKLAEQKLAEEKAAEEAENDADEDAGDETADDGTEDDGTEDADAPAAESDRDEQADDGASTSRPDPDAMDAATRAKVAEIEEDLGYVRRDPRSGAVDPDPHAEEPSKDVGPLPDSSGIEQPVPDGEGGGGGHEATGNESSGAFGSNLIRPADGDGTLAGPQRDDASGAPAEAVDRDRETISDDEAFGAGSTTTDPVKPAPSSTIEDEIALDDFEQRPVETDDPFDDPVDQIREVIDLTDHADDDDGLATEGAAEDDDEFEFEG